MAQAVDGMIDAIGFTLQALRFDAGDAQLRLDPNVPISLVEITEAADGQTRMEIHGPDQQQSSNTAMRISRYAMLNDPDGNVIALDMAELDDGTALFLPSEPLHTGTAYRILDLDRTEQAWAIPDVAPTGSGTGIFGGTILQTPDGDVPVEWLRSGDLVLTRDAGFQPVRRIWRSVLQPADMAAAKAACPVVIWDGALDGIYPLAPLHVAPDSRVLVRSALAELHFGENEVLVRAAALIDGVGIAACLPSQPVTLATIMLDDVHLIAGDGWWIESHDPDTAAQKAAAGAPRKVRYPAPPYITDEEAAVLRSRAAATIGRAVAY